MTNLETVSAIALIGAAIIGTHFIFRLFLYAKTQKKGDLPFIMSGITAIFHFFYIYLFYSGALITVSWLAGTEVLNYYITMILYTMYMRISVSQKCQFHVWDFLPHIILLLQIASIIRDVGSSSYSYTQYVQFYITNLVPDAFLSINYIFYTIIAHIIFLFINIRWLLNTSRSGNWINTSNMILKNKKSIVRYFIFSLTFMMFIRIAYDMSAWLGGRTWAMYYTSIELILLIIIITAHDIHPLLVKARMLKPISGNYEKNESGKSDLKLKQKILFLMEKEKSFTNDTFNLGALSSLLGINKNHTSSIINRYFQCSFPELMHKYRLREAQEILMKNHEIRSSLVGFEVGYKSVSGFYDAFYKKTGMSPQEYREKFCTEQIASNKMILQE